MGDNQHESQDFHGLYSLAGRDIFNYIQQNNIQVDVVVSYFDIYCGKLFDLLNKWNQLQAREDGKQNLHIVGLTSYKINSPGELI